MRLSPAWPAGYSLNAASLLERSLTLLVLAVQVAEGKAQTAACDQEAQRLAGTVEELQEKLRQAPTQEALLASIEAQSQLRQQVSDTRAVLCLQAEAARPSLCSGRHCRAFLLRHQVGQQQPLGASQE